MVVEPMTPRRRHRLAIGCLLLGLCCSGGSPPTLRTRFMAVFQTKAVPDGSTFTLINRRINDRPPHIGFQYRLQDERNHVFGRGFVATFGRKEVQLAGCSTSTCLLQAELPHGCVLQTNVPCAYVASKESFLRLKEWSGKLYFYVPTDCERLTVCGCAVSPGEGAWLRTIDPDGNVAASTGGELESWDKGRMTVKPKPLHRGRAWALQVDSAPGLLLDDVSLAVEDGAPPLLAVHPRWAELLGSQMLTWVEGAETVMPREGEGE